MNDINKLIFVPKNNDKKVSDITYDEAVLNFNTVYIFIQNYELENPVTHDNAVLELMENIKSHYNINKTKLI